LFVYGFRRLLVPESDPAPIEISPLTPDESEMAETDTNPAAAEAAAAEPLIAEQVHAANPVPPAVQPPLPRTNPLHVDGRQLQARPERAYFSIKPAGILAAGIAAIATVGGVIWLFNQGKKGSEKEKKEKKGKKGKKERRHVREWTVYGS
jgi:hypothetical protein